MLTQARLQELLSYNPETGEFFRKTSPTNTVKIGDVAGSRQNTGYLAIAIDNKKYLCHRLAFLLMCGEFPDKQVDHINGVRDDNRWCNLRKATNSQNGFNKRHGVSKTGIKNVYPNGKGYMVNLTVDGEQKYLGTYADIELAELVALEAQSKYHGDYQFNR